MNFKGLRNSAWARKCRMIALGSSLILLGAGCETTSTPPEPLIGKVYPIERTIGGKSVPWGTLVIQKAHVGDGDVGDDGLRAHDLRGSMKDFTALIAQSKIVAAAPTAQAAMNGPYKMSISFYDDFAVANGGVLLSMLALNTVDFKGEVESTVTLVVERSDGLRKFFRAQSSASGKMNLNKLGSLADILHQSTDICCKEILGQMEQETGFFQILP